MRSAFSGNFLALFVAAFGVACSSSSSNPSTPSQDSGLDDSADTLDPCEPGTAVPTYVRSSGDSAEFPADFVFGAASAGMQIEKGLVHADWYQWANQPGHVAGNAKPDDGPDSLDHVADDVAALTNAGAGAYRFSIEWSRVFPTKAQFDAGTPDATAVAQYHAVLKALRDAHIRPFVTLHHFATPDYLDDITQPSEPQSFERPEMKDAFAKWATFAGKEFGGEVDDWITINEPLVLLLGAYVAGAHPPGVRLDFDRMIAAAKNLIRVHAAAYDALHAADTVDAGSGKAANVSMAKHNRAFYPRVLCEDGDVAAAQKAQYIWNEWMYNAIVFGDWDDDFDGQYTSPNDVKGDPTLKGKVDWIGVNFYGDTLVDSSLKLPYIGGTPSFDTLPTPLPKTDMNWDIFPQGIRPILKELAKYQLPIMITENGIADSQDKNKSRYLAEHLWEVGRAIADDGANIKGYFFWSLTDNFEWVNGFCPRFGLDRIDYSDPNRARSPTAAAALYRQISSAHRLLPSSIDALPAYASPIPCPGP